MTFRTLALTLVVALAVLLTAAPAGAAEVGGPALFAGYREGFIDHWTGVFQKQNGIVMLALVVGAVCLFIITRGKWRK